MRLWCPTAQCSRGPQVATWRSGAVLGALGHRLTRVNRHRCISVSCQRSRDKQDGDTRGDGGGVDDDNAFPLTVVAGSAVAVLAGACLTVWRDPISDYLFYESLNTTAGLGAGDLVGGLLWSWSLWFCTPVQLIALFFGKIDKERPSDLVLRVIGEATNQPVTSIDYTPPIYVRAAAASVFVAFGLGLAAVLGMSLGDATWSVSTGLGSCVAAAVYEAGRPRRIGVEEAQELEQQWKDFATFAKVRLQVGGRCHESEVFTAFRRWSPKYRRTGAISDEVLRDLVRYYNSDVERTPRGYLKGVSLTPTVDAFTGQRVGGAQAPVRQGGATGGSVSAQELMDGGGEQGKSEPQVVEVGASQAADSEK